MKIILQGILLTAIASSLSCKKQESAFKGGAKTADALPAEPEGDPEPEPEGIEEPVPEPEEVFEPAVKVGINFEDLPHGAAADIDFNDAVLCFVGTFKVSKTKIVASKSQIVTPTYFSGSSCKHHLEVTIYRGDKITYQKTDIDPNASKPEPLVFKEGDRLEVALRPQSGSCGKPPDRHLMTDTSWGMFQVNKCNDKGD